jgi:hypothetical protein
MKALVVMMIRRLYTA